MAVDDFHDELAALFEAYDNDLIAGKEVFVQRVDQRIGRQQLLRRVVLAGATLVGGLAAGSQLPELLGQMTAYSGGSLSLFDGVAEQLQGPFLWYSMAGFAALVSTLTLLTHDRI